MISSVLRIPTGRQKRALDLADAAKLQSERAYEQQQQLNRAKDQLILNVNHELRTPLTAVSGYLDLLLTFSEQLDAETRVQFLKIAQESCDDLQMLIGNVLDAFRIDSPSPARAPPTTIAKRT